MTKSLFENAEFTESTNPEIIHQHEDGSWWFWDESWSNENGPFSTEDICQTALDEYCEKVLGIPLSEN